MRRSDRKSRDVDTTAIVVEENMSDCVFTPSTWKL